MASNLVIVESPAKAKTLNKYLGDDFHVIASMGHVRDLPKNRFGITIGKGKVLPAYEVIPGREKTLREIKKAARKIEKLFLACDPDREGEAIAWHLAEELALPEESCYRVSFNEITKSAVKKAFEHPTRICMPRVNAQQTRRLLDRLVGYQLSPLLSRKIARNLSAGRVQSVAVRLIVDREKEVRAFSSEEYWRIVAQLSPPGDPAEEAPQRFEAELKKLGKSKFAANNAERAIKIHQELEQGPFVVEKIESRERKRKAPPPYRTSTLQQQASIQLRFSAKKCMSVAQQLYEGIEIVAGQGPVGLITYMRTDSLNVSEEALVEVRSFLAGSFEKRYRPHKANRFKREKGAKTQDAHEAIRPTSAFMTPESLSPVLTKDQLRLYTLIWQRFVASQMAPAVIATTVVDIVSGRGLFRANGKIKVFDGWTKVSPEKSEDTLLPVLEKGQVLDLYDLVATQHFTQPPPRFSEATLVKTLEKEGIGRPSTYAAIISTIQARKYVIQKDRRFYATDLGIIVTDKLVKHFPDIMNIGFTSTMENHLDKIEDETLDWQGCFFEFFKPFDSDLWKAMNEMTGVNENPEKSNVPCPECGEVMVYLFSKPRKERFLGCSKFPECKATYSIDELGRPLVDEKTSVICELCGEPMVVKHGKGGRFFSCSRFPECRHAMQMDEEGKPVVPELSNFACGDCGKPLAVRKGRWGDFLSCTAYPECRYTADLDGKTRSKPEATDEKCKKCGKSMWIRRGRRGRFVACSGYPKCRSTRSLPGEEKPPEPAGIDCDRCGKPMVIKNGRKGPFISCSGYPKCKNTKQLASSQAEPAGSEEAAASQAKDAPEKPASPRKKANKRISSRKVSGPS